MVTDALFRNPIAMEELIERCDDEVSVALVRNGDRLRIFGSFASTPRCVVCLLFFALLGLRTRSEATNALPIVTHPCALIVTRCFFPTSRNLLIVHLHSNSLTTGPSTSRISHQLRVPSQPLTLTSISTYHQLEPTIYL